MAAVRLPDGEELEIEPGAKALAVAEAIGPRLARDAVVAKLDGKLIDLDTPLDGGGEFEILPKGSRCCGTRRRTRWPRRSSSSTLAAS
jgi:threonyl-tRNA synthetase